MKKLELMVLTLITLALAGCNQQKAPQIGQDTSQREVKNQISEVQTKDTGLIVGQNIKEEKNYSGNYEGSVEMETCGVYLFKIQINQNTVSGSGEGEKDVNCKANISGIVDKLGNLSGKADGEDTLFTRGQKFQWFYEGNFSGKMEDGGGNMTVELQATSHLCPANIPCEDISKTLQLALRKI